jgi:replication-associated recombination protein RarA
MLHGNAFAQQTFRTTIQSLQQDGNNRPVFLVLTWPENIGKTTAAQEIVKGLLGSFFASDFLWIQDLTQLLWKKHSIKVGDKSETNIIELSDGTEYEDKSIREVINRLQRSSASGKKILLLENIERMTIGAANAFLKAAEEPLSGRIIIATTTHVSHIMPTIVSRAIIIPFQALTSWEIDAFIDDADISLPAGELKNFYKRMAMGRPGVLLRLANLDTPMQQVFLSALQALQSKQSIHDMYAPLLKIHKAGYLSIFLDAWIAQITAADSIQARHWIQVKKQLQSNVNPDRILLAGLLAI